MKVTKPRVLTEDEAGVIVGAFSTGAGWALAARLVKSSRSNLQRIVAADPALQERVDDARAIADDQVEKSLFTKATVDRDTTACLAWLHNRRPSEWRQRRELHLTSDVKAAAAKKAAELGISAEEIIALATEIAAEAMPGMPEGLTQ